MNDLIKRQDAIDAVRNSYDEILDFSSNGHTIADSVEDIINTVQAIKTFKFVRCKNCAVMRLSNKEWIDFLVAQFNISRTSARNMLHVMMQVKREDNFKKKFSGAKKED